MEQQVSGMKSGRIHPGNFKIQCITQGGEWLVHANVKTGKVLFDMCETQGSDSRILVYIQIIVPDQKTIKN